MCKNLQIKKDIEDIKNSQSSWDKKSSITFDGESSHFGVVIILSHTYKRVGYA